MKIVVLDGRTLNPGDNPWNEVARLGDFTCFDATSRECIVPRSANAEILLTNKTPITAETLSQLPRLKFIGVLATGYNVVDVAAARAREILVANVPEYGTDSVAEYVFAMLLNFQRQVQRHAQLVQDGEWERNEWTFWRTPLTELAGLTMGIVGFGRIGRRVAELAAAFKMNVLVHHPNSNRRLPENVSSRALPDLFSESDVVSLHCKLTSQNAGMVNRALLERMKPGAYLINTARGQLINEMDLAAVLREGKIAGAALDVISTEPMLPESPLKNVPNLTITPHIAWATLAARKRLMRTTAQNIASFLAGKPINLVN